MRLGCSLVCFFDPVSFLSYTIRVLPSALSLRNSVTNASGDERQVAWLQGCRPGAMDMVRLVDLRPGIYRPSAPACVRSEIDIVKQHEKLSLSWQLETSKPHMVGCPCGSAWGPCALPAKPSPQEASALLRISMSIGHGIGMCMCMCIKLPRSIICIRPSGSRALLAAAEIRLPG